jgi:O-antigen/teichoic acid export membrane protein
MTSPGVPSDIEQPPDSMSGAVVRGVGLAGIGYVLSQIISFATYLALAKLATPADFGQFAAGTIVVGVGMTLSESGMLAALIQRKDRLEEALNSAFLATLIGGVVFSLLALAAAPIIGFFFHSHEVGIVAAVMSGWMLLRLATIIPDASLQRRFSFFRRVIVDPLGVIAFAAGSIVAAAAGMGVWALIIGTYAQASVNVVAAWALAGWRPQPRLATIAMWRELARFGRPVLGAEFIRRIVSEIPVVAIGRFVGTGALGQFTYASRVASQPLGAIVNVGGYVLLPAFSRLSTHDARFRAALLRALRWVCVLAFPAGMIIVPLGMPAIVVIFGEQWRQAGYGAMALSGACAALALDSIASEAWKAYGRPDMLPRMHSISLLLTAICVGALVPFGLVGVTIGISVSAIGVAAYAVRGMSSVLDIPIRRLLTEIWPPAVAAVVMAGSLVCLEFLVVHADRRGTVDGLALLAGETLLGVALYLGALAVVARGTVRELLAALRDLSARRHAHPPPGETV